MKMQILVRSILFVALFILLGAFIGNSQAVLAVSPATDNTVYLPLLFRYFFNSTIVFSSGRDGNFELYKIDPNQVDGDLHATRLTNDPSDEWIADLSPDGDEIVFDSYRSGAWEIYKMNSDGSQVIQLTFTTHNNGPRWSPDGSKIVFFTDRGNHYAVCVMNADGSEQKIITDPLIEAIYPIWSPDGTKIAYIAWKPDPTYIGGIYTANPDGSEHTLLLGNVGVKNMDWSPDGRYLAISQPDRKAILIYDIENQISTSVTPSIGPTSSKNEFVSWSPDGLFIRHYRNLIWQSNHWRVFLGYRIDPQGVDRQCSVTTSYLEIQSNFWH